MDWTSLNHYLHRLELHDCPVTQSIFGTTAVAAIEAQLQAFAQHRLAAKILACGFAYVSVGATFVVRLSTHEIVVMKAYGLSHGLKALRPKALQVSFQIQRELAETNFPCPELLLPPQVFKDTLFVVQSYCDPGEPVAPFAPFVRQQMAARLAQLLAHTRTRRFTDLAAWMPWLQDAPDLWPTPHNAMFDFPKTAAGAEWIDTIAAQAKQVITTVRLPWVVGHSDWSLQNMAFYQQQLTCVFDWDSLRIGPEACFVGGTARCFTHDWRYSRPSRPLLPAEAEAFVQDYETARGWSFAVDEYRVLRAAMVYTIAYGARCAHALNPEADWTFMIKGQLKEFYGRYLGS